MHVMWDCPQAMVVRLNLVGEEDRNEFFDGNLIQWIDLNLSKELGVWRDTNWRDVWSIACHNLGKWRNNKMHHEEF